MVVVVVVEVVVVVVLVVVVVGTVVVVVGIVVVVGNPLPFCLFPVIVPATVCDKPLSAR